jgi:hypothetical protein
VRLGNSASRHSAFPACSAGSERELIAFTSEPSREPGLTVAGTTSCALLAIIAAPALVQPGARNGAERIVERPHLKTRRRAPEPP